MSGTLLDVEVVSSLWCAPQLGWCHSKFHEEVTQMYSWQDVAERTKVCFVP